MSKNPAWNAYNEAVRKANEDYEATIKPLRISATKEIAVTEKRFDDQIEPLIAEKKTLVQGLKDTYSNKVVETEKARREAVKRAADVRNVELAAAKETAAIK
jgi:hypothetical protein